MVVFSVTILVVGCSRKSNNSNNTNSGSSNCNTSNSNTSRTSWILLPSRKFVSAVQVYGAARQELLQRLTIAGGTNYFSLLQALFTENCYPFYFSIFCKSVHMAWTGFIPQSRERERGREIDG